ncbi:LemA family protein [Variovorax sp. dw_308]|uniref:LemA family protein n=1 Tax=Variovorax sp. dw_308 TaxID=2721546 RepID=UPI001C46D302|nr:LemA family protein [Variovorax sp. dw_308]
MNLLPEGWPWWIVGAVALFWFIGAHNRLVRLRSSALQAYGALDAALMRQLDFVQTHVIPTEPGAFGPGELTSGASLRAAARQFGNMLGATRKQPLDMQAMAALGTALHALLSAWQRQHGDPAMVFEADGTLSRPAPLGSTGDDPAVASVAVPIAWPEASAAPEIARGQFNQAVLNYNAAIAQFPAMLMAFIFGMRRAMPLI